MFRQLSEARAHDNLEKIINNAAIIQDLTAHKSISSKLAILVHNLLKFDKHRFIDFLENKSERAIQALHAVRIFYSHYNKHLKNSKFHYEATQILDGLMGYEELIIKHIESVEQDLDKIRTPLMQSLNDAIEKSYADQLLQERNAEERALTIDELLLKTVETNGFDYFGITDLTLLGATVKADNLSDSFYNYDNKAWVYSPLKESGNTPEDVFSDLADFAAQVNFDTTDDENDSSYTEDSNDLHTSSSDEEEPLSSSVEEISEDRNHSSGETVEDTRGHRTGSRNASPASPRFFASPRVHRTYETSDEVDYSDIEGSLHSTSEEESPRAKRPLFI